jgi:hypothetical protein
MALDAEVGEHPRKKDFADPAFAQLKRKIVGLRAPHFVRANDHGTAVLDEWLVPRKPVRAGAGEAIPAKWIGTKEFPGVVHHLLDDSAKLPILIMRIQVVGRNEDAVVLFLGGHEQAG